MNFPEKYNCLKINKYQVFDYSILPIRFNDRLEIMKWRNEQVYHLRQKELLTIIEQNNYFESVVKELFNKKTPNQILFSYLKNGECIGYGGLVHINWIDKNAEISFIMDTSLEKNEFHLHWNIFLGLIEQVAFEDLNFHKIFTYAFDLRPHLYEAIENSGFLKEAVLKEHCFFENSFKDVIIHSKKNKYLDLRKVNEKDVDLLFNWANDALTRDHSFQSKEILLPEHRLWFHKRLKDKNSNYYICQVNKKPAGLIRFDKNIKGKTIIGITIDREFRGKKVASSFLRLACKAYLENNSVTIFAEIKTSNIASVKTFEKAGFIFKKEIKINQILAYIYTYEKK